MWRVAWSHPKFGSLLASCSYDGRVQIYSIAKDKSYSVVYVYAGHKASGPFCCVFLICSELCRVGSVRVWTVLGGCFK